MFWGKAIIENNYTKVTDEEVDKILTSHSKSDKTFIQDHFKNFYFQDCENAWLDTVVQRICDISDEYKQAILMSSLFQACLAKRPFNLFHRKNLYLRTAQVQRTFGNKTTWETPFPILLKRYVAQYNSAVFSNKRRNKVIGGYHAIDIARKADLVYLDPPYFSSKSTYGTNYLNFYHFLEGLADYSNWESRMNPLTKKINSSQSEQLVAFTRKSKVVKSFEKLIAKFSDRIIVLSYQDNGIPSKDKILEIFKQNKKKVKVFEREHSYVLSKQKSKELLFVSTN